MKDGRSRAERIRMLTEQIQQRADILEMSDEGLRRVIESTVREIPGAAPPSYRETAALECGIFNSIRGLSVLDRLLADRGITEIMINGHDQIFIEKKGVVARTPEQFADPAQLLSIITKLVSAAGRTVSFSNPIVDARLADGSRVNVVLDPVAVNGPIVTVRRFPDRPMTVGDLVSTGTLTKEAAAFLKKAFRSKCNIFICGGTGSGKTTLLNALVNDSATAERIVTIEDSAELQLPAVVNLVRLEARTHHYDGSKSVTIRDLIRTSLRMRPERIIVGEVRGEEALDMLQAMNTGHDGSLSTGHANSCEDMFSRLETMVLSGAAGLPLTAVQRQIESAIDLIVFLKRVRGSVRRVAEISEVLTYREEKVCLNPIFLLQETGSGGMVPELMPTDNRLRSLKKMMNCPLSINRDDEQH